MRHGGSGWACRPVNFAIHRIFDSIIHHLHGRRNGVVVKGARLWTSLGESLPGDLLLTATIHPAIALEAVRSPRILGGPWPSIQKKNDSGWRTTTPG